MESCWRKGCGSIRIRLFSNPVGLLGKHKAALLALAVLTLSYLPPSTMGSLENQQGQKNNVLEHANLIWANLTAAQVNSSFPYSRKGSSTWTNETEATYLAGGILALQTGNSTYLAKANELCVWLNSTDKRNLFYSYDLSTGRWTAYGTTGYAAMRLAELAVYANISCRWKPLLKEVANMFLNRYVNNATNRIYSAVLYSGWIADYIAGSHQTSDTIAALTLAANVLGDRGLREEAYKLIMSYSLGATRLPYHQIRQDGSPYAAYCKEDETFGLYVLAMETYHNFFPKISDVKRRIEDVVQAGYRYLWNPEKRRWNYRVNADTGAVIANNGVHGFGYVDEAFLQAALIWNNATWLVRAKSDMDEMVLREAIVRSGGLIAHSTSEWSLDSDEYWNVAARRTLVLFYNLNQAGFHHNASYLTCATNLFECAADAHERSKGWQQKIYLSDHSDYEPLNTRLQLSVWLQYVNRTDAAINTLADVYRKYGVPQLGAYTSLPPISATASPASTSISLGESIAFASSVMGGLSPYDYQWYLGGHPVAGATSRTWIFAPTAAGVYYVHLEVADWLGSTARSEIARITVTTSPVGGHSFSVEMHETGPLPLTYLAIATIATTAFIVIRRKTKRRQHSLSPKKAFSGIEDDKR
jgi:hypothetical protein